MNVQPYFPEPLVVEGNVADERYLVRLGFVRRVVAVHYVSILAIAIVAATTRATDLGLAAWVVAGSLLALSLTRRLAPHSRADLAVSALLMGPLLISLGLLAGYGASVGMPWWPTLVACTAAAGYTALCGRDFSFVGQFAMSAIATIVVVATAAILGRATTGEAMLGLILALSYLFYFVYDLAALLTRRRLGEEFAAVVDLFRDCLNVISYSFRVVDHWRKFRI